MDKWITEKAVYKCKRSSRGCTWEKAINDYYRDVSPSLFYLVMTPTNFNVAEGAFLQILVEIIYRS